MAGNGPAPKDSDQRARRNVTFAMTKLPAEGRQGPAPKWPLIDDIQMRAQVKTGQARIREVLKELDDCSDGRSRNRLNRELGRLQEYIAVLREKLRAQRRLEIGMWRDMWATPQAVQWELLGWSRDVATYVRHKVLGELGDLASAKEARLWSDRLGLNPTAMLRLRWQVEHGVAASERKAERQPASRDRYPDLRVVGGAETDAA